MHWEGYGNEKSVVVLLDKIHTKIWKLQSDIGVGLLTNWFWAILLSMLQAILDKYNTL